MQAARSAKLVLFHDPYAFFAAATARSKSPFDASGTCVKTFPSAGLITPAVFPPSALSYMKEYKCISYVSLSISQSYGDIYI